MTLVELGASLRDLNVGVPSAPFLVRAMLAAHGLRFDVSPALHERLHPGSLAGAAEDAGPAIRRALSFLRDRCAIPLVTLAPDPLIVFVLVRFFALYPEPQARSLDLLSRWVWRAIDTDAPERHRALYANLIASSQDRVEDAWVQRLLQPTYGPRRSDGDLGSELVLPMDPWTSTTRLVVLALASLQPRHLETGEPIDIAGGTGTARIPVVASWPESDESMPWAAFLHPPDGFAAMIEARLKTHRELDAVAEPRHRRQRSAAHARTTHHEGPPHGRPRHRPPEPHPPPRPLGRARPPLARAPHGAGRRRRHPMSRTLLISLYGAPIGHLIEGSRGGSELRLLDSYRDLVPRPTLGQWFLDHPDRRIVEHPGLPAFFANLVPEGDLRRIIARSAAIPEADDFAFLAAVGDDLPGAVTIREDAELDEPDVAPVTDALDPARPNEGRLRFSLAGVQLKLSMVRDGHKLTLPARGKAGAWIVKFPSDAFPGLIENEYATLAWARRAGFDVADHELVPATELTGVPPTVVPHTGTVLVLRRYDRGPSGPIHQEDFAQVAGLAPRHKFDHITYEQLGRVVGGIIGPAAVAELLRRIVLMVAVGNNDGHLKNWSLVYPDRIHAAWSPVYDQACSLPWPQLDQDLALELAGTKIMNAVDLPFVRKWARKAGMDGDEAVAIAERTVDALADTFAGVAPLMATVHSNALRAHWRKVPLLRSRPLA